MGKDPRQVVVDRLAARVVKSGADIAVWPNEQTVALRQTKLFRRVAQLRSFADRDDPQTLTSGSRWLVVGAGNKLSPMRPSKQVKQAARLSRGARQLGVGHATVLIERMGPIGVVDLAGRIGRDHTTVSRQVARLEELGLVERRSSSADKRVRTAVVTPQGKAATDALDRAREDMVVALFGDWARADFDDLVRLMRMFVDTMQDRRN